MSETPSPIATLFPWNGPTGARNALVSADVPARDLRAATDPNGRLAVAARASRAADAVISMAFIPLMAAIITATLLGALLPGGVGMLMTGVGLGVSLTMLVLIVVPVVARLLLARRERRFLARHAAHIIDGGSVHEAAMAHFAAGGGPLVPQKREVDIVHMVGCIAASPRTDELDLWESVDAAFRFRDTLVESDFELIERLHAKAHGGSTEPR